MLSMTGFGRATVVADGRRFVVEVRSVNNRGIDVKVRARDLEAACEIEIVRAVRAAVERGSVIVSVREETGASATVNLERARSVYTTLEALREELKLPGPVDLATVGIFLATPGAAADSGATLRWEMLQPAAADALRALQAMRATEGAALAADLRRRLDRLREVVGAIADATRGLPSRAARRLEERLSVLAGQAGIDAGRMAQEVALLAEKLDVSEELVRLDAHLAQLAVLFGDASGTAIGRKMDFLIQEVGRELNTVGSKVQDAQVAALVVDGKAELEKIREQAQNIE